MKTIFAPIALALVIPAATAMASEAAPAPAPAPAFSTSTSTIGELMDNASAKAVLMKHIPEMISNPQMEMARPMTLKQIQPYSGEALSDETLAKIDVDLAGISAQ